MEDQSVADFIAVGTNIKQDPFANDMEVVTVMGQTGASAVLLDEVVYLPVTAY